MNAETYRRELADIEAASADGQFTRAQVDVWKQNHVIYVKKDTEEHKRCRQFGVKFCKRFVCYAHEQHPGEPHWIENS